MGCVVAIGGCAAEPANEAETSESFVGSGGTVVGGRDGLRSIPSRMNHDVVALRDGSAVTPLDAKYVDRHYLNHALEFVPAKGGTPVAVEVPVPFYYVLAGPDDSALTLGLAGDERFRYQVRPSSPPKLLARGMITGITTANDGSIMWVEDGAKLHRLRGASDTVVTIPYDPAAETPAHCRSFAFADASRYYDVCFSDSLARSENRVARVRTIAPDGGFALVGAANEDFGIVKLRADGSLDPEFDKDGAMSFDVPDWGALAAGRASDDGERLELLGFGPDRTYAVDVWLR